MFNQTGADPDSFQLEGEIKGINCITVLLILNLLFFIVAVFAMFYNDVFYFVNSKGVPPPSPFDPPMLDLCPTFVNIDYQFTTNMHAMINDYNKYNQLYVCNDL